MKETPKKRWDKRLPLVSVHVCGGVAYVNRLPPNIRLQITDWDNDPKRGCKGRYSGRRTDDFATPLEIGYLRLCRAWLLDLATDPEVMDKIRASKVVKDRLANIVRAAQWSLDAAS